MVFCTNCGQKIQGDSAKFCISCGTPVAAVKNQQPPSSAPPTGGQPQAPPGTFMVIELCVFAGYICLDCY